MSNKIVRILLRRKININVIMLTMDIRIRVFYYDFKQAYSCFKIILYSK